MGKSGISPRAGRRKGRRFYVAVVIGTYATYSIGPFESRTAAQSAFRKAVERLDEQLGTSCPEALDGFDQWVNRDEP